MKAIKNWNKENWQDIYEEVCKDVAIYPTGNSMVWSDQGKQVTVFLDEMYLLPALAGEVGELLSIYAKATRDNQGNIEEEDMEKISKELGDILFMVNQLARGNNETLESIARKNANKLLSRKERGTIKGSGDNR